ncbi:cell wall hydrolase [Roseomonas sp. OT10]|uniref:cell wall hydrolase n=1 Tax=Roseomonas cutis TaxID=2897332 RepID=UPI001E487743|nr:cell wall hydrolase [Roseomonas sp. OT10]UFN47969.1 cell wall hydrolase [Roseomonas sp. OT10]
MRATPHSVAIRSREAAVLSLTLYAEAGGRPVRAIEALAALVMNRLAAGRPEWGVGVEAVCRAPFHFPCWNPRHPRHTVLRAVPPADPAMAICRRIAARAIAGVLPDPTGGATHYHEETVLPGWARAEAPLAALGGLVFYRPVPGAPPVPASWPALALA